MYTLIVLQGLTGDVSTQGADHSGGATQILKSRGFAGARDEFEEKVLLSMRGPIVSLVPRFGAISIV